MRISELMLTAPKSGFGAVCKNGNRGVVRGEKEEGLDRILGIR